MNIINKCLNHIVILNNITDEDRICDKIAELLNVPDEYEVVCILPVGKAADDFHAPGKKPFGERVKFNSWDGEL